MPKKGGEIMVSKEPSVEKWGEPRKWIHPPLGKFTDEELKDVERTNKQLMEMDPTVLRALIRQCSHRIDNGIQRYFLNPEETVKRMGGAIGMMRAALSAWEKRGYEVDKPDIKYAYDALKRGGQFASTPVYHPSPPHAPFSERDLKVVEKVIFERRAVRRFSDRDVPDDVLNKVFEAAIHAPCACCFQGVRFIVIREAEKRKLIGQPWASPVIIMAGVDKRPYQEFLGKAERGYNRLVDVGVAVQNLLLMAHALGLGTCIATYIDEPEVDVLRRELEIPEYIEIVTYIVLGWPADEPTTVPRMEVGEFVSINRWSGS